VKSAAAAAAAATTAKTFCCLRQWFYEIGEGLSCGGQLHFHLCDYPATNSDFPAHFIAFSQRKIRRLWQQYHHVYCHILSEHRGQKIIRNEKHELVV
jgi:hypothetical protein